MKLKPLTFFRLTFPWAAGTVSSHITQSWHQQHNYISFTTSSAPCQTWIQVNVFALKQSVPPPLSVRDIIWTSQDLPPFTWEEYLISYIDISQRTVAMCLFEDKSFLTNLLKMFCMFFKHRKPKSYTDFLKSHIKPMILPLKWAQTSNGCVLCSPSVRLASQYGHPYVVALLIVWINLANSLIHLMILFFCVNRNLKWSFNYKNVTQIPSRGYV